MKHLRLLLILVCMLAIGNMSAQIVYEGHIYNVIGVGEVELAGPEEDSYVYIEFVPETITDDQGNQYTVTAIGEEAYGGYDTLESIWLPSTIKRIGDHAFVGCENLVYVNTDEELELEYLGEGAFASCSNLPIAYFHNSVKEIKSDTYCNCEKIESLSFSDIDNIGSSAFQGCTGLKSVSFQKFKSIGGGAFAHCPNLESVNFMSDFGTIGRMAFNNCHSLEQIVFWGGGEAIEDEAFENCTALKRIAFVFGHIKKFGSGAFRGCKNLSDVYINDYKNYCLAEFDNSSASPFNSGAKLHYVYGQAFTGPEHEVFDLSQLNLPYISAHAFYNCSNIEKLVLPEGLTSIGKWAFGGCSALNSVTIPSTLTDVHDEAFKGVGTQEAPCQMKAPVAYPFGVSTTGNYFLWKSGCFWMESKNYMTAEAGDIIKGANGTLTVSLNNVVDSYNGYQFDVQLPDGITLDAENYTLSDRYSKDGMNVMVKQLDNGAYRVVCFSIGGISITGTEGALISFPIKASSDAASGAKEGRLKNVMVSDQTGKNTILPDVTFTLNVSEYVLGDVNHDHVMSIADVMAVATIILYGTDNPASLAYADIDGDGNVSISDVMGLIEMVFNADYPDTMANGCTTADFINASPTDKGCDLMLCNAGDYTSFQMDIQLPEGKTLKSATIDTGRADGHRIYVRRLANGAYRLLAFNTEAAGLKGHQGALLHLNIPGGSDIAVKNIQFVTSDHRTVWMDDVAGSATGISQIGDNASISPKYTLSGIEATSATKGIVIENGKKYIRR